MAITLPTEGRLSRLPGGVHINANQRHLLIHYNVVDPGCELLGYHSGRPVVWTYFVRPSIHSTQARRHVIIVQRNGLPGDLPSNWEDNWHHLDHGSSHASLITKRKRVTSIIEDWFTWSTGS